MRDLDPNRAKLKEQGTLGDMEPAKLKVMDPQFNRNGGTRPNLEVG